ncbi:hypothetical protein MAPG_00653 [Magnaporthiopsis poae ATCC 64411]|uniref:2EXR domain-containing protein n=1 Tax=Magnaporthiopsis poae (strain ATCC 64411 / 73-15) TaxID=644358 RepID=A0A0C4DLK9_MAGP6|nr:hypothetical protein MAPG_00653 [Magnaporthiopsis poae ATCC 64411]
MAAKTQLCTLPVELRSEIWSLALLPSPGVYRCDPSKFIHTRSSSRRRLEVEDARWLIPKRRYPTVVHLCRESRLFALGVMEKEVRENSFFYCIGQDARPFIPEIDTFWFDDDDNGAILHYPAVVQERGAIGSRVHTIRNLAVSAAVVQSCRRGDCVSNWDSYMFRGIGRFENLRRVDVVFGPVPMETRCDGYKTDRDCWAAAAREQVLEQYNGQVVLTGMYDVPEVGLMKEIRGSGFETTGSSADEDQDRDPVVKEILDKVRADVYECFEKRARYLARYPPPRPQGQEDAAAATLGQGQGQGQQQKRVAEVVHREKDLSEVTFHAARMAETARFRGRTIRKSFPSWYFSEDDDFELPSRLPSVKKRGSRALPA